MTNYTNARFYAISTIGWGKGFTPEEAVKNYYDEQAQNFPRLHRTIKGRIAKLKESAPPTVFEAPVDAEGFATDGHQVFWDLVDGSRVPVTSDPVPCEDSSLAPS